MELRPYQIEDAQKLITRSGTGCFNEQRTGKTPTALETIRLRNLTDKRILIVATTSSLYQWQEEYTRWLGKPCTVCTGTPTKRKKLIENWTHGLVVSLDSVKITKNSTGMLSQILKQKPTCVILDEAHRIKTPTSANAKAMFALSKVPYRLALTGTPAPGRPYDIFSILKFLEPETFRSEWTFKNDYFIPEYKILWKGRRQIKFTEYNTFRPGMEKQLQKHLAKISTQRKRKDVMPWLPDKDYMRIRLQPSLIQTRELKRLHETFKVGNIETQGVLDSLIRERQLCLSPELLDITGKSPKTEYILQYLKDYPEEPILIFSAFTSYLKLLYNILSEHYKVAMIIGDTPAKRREIYKKDFQEGLFNILLVNIKAGKEALTLDRAETALFCDKYPPIGDILQAEDRFIATTQAKADKPHKIIELMITDSFDERIYTLLQERLTETDIINNYNKYLKKGVPKYEQLK